MKVTYILENPNGKEKNQLWKELRESERYDEKYSEIELKSRNEKDLLLEKLQTEYREEFKQFHFKVENSLEKYVVNEIHRRKIKNALIEGYGLPKEYYEYTSKTTISINVEENTIILEWQFPILEKTETLMKEVELANKILVEKGDVGLKEAFKQDFKSRYKGLCGGFNPTSPFLLIRRAYTPFGIKKENNYLSISQFFYLDKMK